MKKMNKKGVFNQLSPLALGLVSLAVVLTVGFLIMAEFGANTQVAADSNASAAIAETQLAMSDIPGWLGIIVIAVIGSLLLGLVRFFRS